MNQKQTLKHWVWDEHKYIAKVKRLDGSYRYFYDADEYQSYLTKNKLLGYDIGRAAHRKIIFPIHMGVKEEYEYARADRVEKGFKDLLGKRWPLVKDLIDGRSESKTLGKTSAKAASFIEKKLKDKIN